MALMVSAMLTVMAETISAISISALSSSSGLGNTHTLTIFQILRIIASLRFGHFATGLVDFVLDFHTISANFGILGFAKILFCNTFFFKLFQSHVGWACSIRCHKH